MKSLFSNYSTQSPENVFELLKSSKEGLSAQEADHRLQLYGENRLTAKTVSLWKLVLNQFRSSFVYLLLIASICAFCFKEYVDGTLILAAVVINVILSFYQEYKAERTAQLLKSFLVSYVKVIRDGKETVISHHELVPGDIIIVEPGSIIPADMRFVDVHSLSIDESTLTGESVPVLKTAEQLPAESLSLHEARNIGFRGTKVVNGHGQGVIFATGKKTVMSDIATLATGNIRRSSLAVEIEQFSRFILYLIAGALCIVFCIHFFLKGTAIGWGNLITFYIALAISLIPEGLPVIITFALSGGATLLARHKVIVKRLLSIVNLGSMDVLCTDKTGTLTENKLTMHDAYYHLSTENVVFFASLAYESALNEAHKEIMNPFDCALNEKLTPEERNDIFLYKRTGMIPFTSDRRINSVIVTTDDRFQLVVRGAPETVLKKSINISENEAQEIHSWLREKGKQGARLMAVARRFISKEKITEEDEESLELIGILSFVDPLKKSTREAVKMARSLGVQIKLITGDSKEVGHYIAEKIHLSHDHSVIEGAEFEKMTPEEKARAVEHASVFVRSAPQQKYEIVKLLQKNHEVGFIGDGINDAPSLNVADTGIAVKQAADIAREAADIILMKNDLKVLINAIREGRKIFVNINKYIITTLASNFGNFFAIACASFMMDNLPMRATQILLMNILTDIPLIALATDTVSDSEVQQPLRYNIKRLSLISIILGIVSAVFDFIFFWTFKGMPIAMLQTNWFIGSMLTEVAFVLSIRTRKFLIFSTMPSAALFGTTLLVAIVSVLIPFSSLGHAALGFITPKPYHLIVIAAIVLAYTVTTDCVKWCLYKMGIE